MKSYSIFEINDTLKGTIIGSTSQNITSTEELTRARLSDISFIGNKKYEKLWNTSAASIAVVNKDISIEPGENRAFIQVDNADLARSEEHTSELQSRPHLVCRLLLEKKKQL